MGIVDIKPISSIAQLNRDEFKRSKTIFNIEDVSEVVGMSSTFIKRALGTAIFSSSKLSAENILELLDSDSFSETFVPRSKVLNYLISSRAKTSVDPISLNTSSLILGDALDLIKSLPPESIQCVVTSTPYWAMRIYDDMVPVSWADGEVCPFGHEQTPEGFIRHTIETLLLLKRVMKENGSVWWNIMDTYNTRTQIRGNAAETLRAMQGKDKTSWNDHACRRYSAGHSYLKDGEQCLIPTRIAERAARIGYFVKSVSSWTKSGSMPEPQNSRVSRNIEYVLHLSKTRAPYFEKDIYRTHPAKLGGRNNGSEPDKLSDFWYLPTSSGRDGHGAQFPLALPARCIALTSKQNDFILDPFMGAGTTAVAATLLGRKYVGFDVGEEYIKTAQKRIKNAEKQSSLFSEIEKLPLSQAV